ncbi:MAG: hypothetical protein IJV90_03840, partial [Candidatus Methanomethylophilaceae archaeon]|nr:hypothetical protein [Candidatus Methanomethylophilaceae archaeon]
VHGALSSSKGLITVHDGDFRTVLCEKYDECKGTSHYGFYFTGSSGKDVAVINGGIFDSVTEGYPGLYINNQGIDGGDRDYCEITVNGGTFIDGVWIGSTKNLKLTVKPEFDFNITNLDVVTTNDEFAKQIESGYSEIILYGGMFEVPSGATNKTLSLIGLGNNVGLYVEPQGMSDGEGGGQLNYSLDGSKVTFDNLIIKTDGNYQNGFVRMDGTFNNCVFNGTYYLQSYSEFNNCEFNVSACFRHPLAEL